MEYRAIYLNTWKLVDNAALPYFNNSTTQEISYTLEVNGAATDASASLNESPTFAAFKAGQSLAPSPQKPTMQLNFVCRFWITEAF